MPQVKLTKITVLSHLTYTWSFTPGSIFFHPLALPDFCALQWYKLDTDQCIVVCLSYNTFGIWMMFDIISASLLVKELLDKLFSSIWTSSSNALSLPFSLFFLSFSFFLFLFFLSFCSLFLSSYSLSWINSSPQYEEAPQWPCLSFLMAAIDWRREAYTHRYQTYKNMLALVRSVDKCD